MIAIFAPQIAKKRKRIISLFRETKALSPDSAKSIVEIGLSKNVLFEIQKLRGIIVEVEQNRFYLDEIWEGKVKQYRKVFALVFALLFIFLAWYFNNG